MVTKHDVIRVHQEHPEWCSTEIGRELGCDSAYVRATAQRNGLTLANKMGHQGPYKWTPDRVGELHRLYTVPSVAAVAKHFGIAPESIRAIACRFGVPRHTDQISEPAE